MLFLIIINISLFALACLCLYLSRTQRRLIHAIIDVRANLSMETARLKHDMYILNQSYQHRIMLSNHTDHKLMSLVEPKIEALEKFLDVEFKEKTYPTPQPVEAHYVKRGKKK